MIPRRRAWFIWMRPAAKPDWLTHKVLVLTPGHVTWKELRAFLGYKYPSYTFEQAPMGDVDFEWVIIAPKGLVEIEEERCYF